MRIKITDMDNFIKTFNHIYPKNTINKINGITIDSRKLEEYDIFIPLKGETYDGHDFINKALTIKGTISLNQNKRIENKRVIQTKSNIEALTKLASLWRKKISSSIIAITGSNGKTTTKELLYHILKDKYKCSKSSGNHNSSIGLPLSLLNCNINDEYTILELGANQKGEIADLCNLVMPNYSLITNISNNHIENYNSFNELVETKLAIFKKLKVSGIAFINLNDKEISKVQLPNKKITFGMCKDSDFNGILDNNNLIINNVTFNIPTRLLHLTNTILSIYAISKTLNISDIHFQNSINSFSIPSGRGNSVTVNDYTIIDDAYNASPSSMILGIKRFSRMHSKNRKILIIGDMLELGRYANSEHEKLGSFINNLNIDMVLTFGTLTKKTFSKLDDSFIYKGHFDSMKALKKIFKSKVEKNDFIYLKGSRFIKLERIYK